MDSGFYRQLLPFSRGDVPAELVIRNARVANVFSFDYEWADVAIAQGVIVGVGPGYTGLETVDAEGRVLIPGMIDGHIHIESSMLTPSGFAEAAVPRGTSAVMADPHEIANVWGSDGIRAMKANAQGLPMDFFWGASSCVPASEFETCQEPLAADALAELLHHDVCQHLGEMMNYPAVIAGDSAIWEKIQAAEDYPLTGHGPRLSGKALCAYLLSGCYADHESTSFGEGLEKLNRGGWVMMRAGAAANDLPELAPLVIAKPARCSRVMVVSDDFTAAVLVKQGHMDAKMRAMCQLGIDPLIALRMVTLTPAEYFRLPRRGGIAPGWLADLALVDSLESCQVDRVWKQGRLVARAGALCGDGRKTVSFCLPPSPQPAQPKPLSAEVIEVPAPPDGMGVRVIGWHRGSLLTESLVVRPLVKQGFVVADPENDIAKLVVQGRNRHTEKVSVGFVKGLGLRRGALGASVAHDSHPFIVAGADDLSIGRALVWLQQQGGGVVACEGERILAALPLPVAGLMNEAGAGAVAEGLNAVDQAAAALGIQGEHPCMALSFLSLSVIPSLKLTDQGYVDLSQGGLQNLFVKISPNLPEK